MNLIAVQNRSLPGPVLLALVLFIASSTCHGKTNADIVKDRDEGGVEIYRFSIPDDALVKGYIIKPTGNGPFPGVLISHGAGNSASKFGVEFGLFFADNGFVGIACDYTHRGEGGKSSIQRSKQPGFGFGASQENLRRALKVLEILKGLDYVDRDRIAAYGNSMGAFLTAGFVAQGEAVREIKVAAITAGGIEYAGLEGHSKGKIIQPAAIDEKEAARIHCPMLLIHGARDPNVPPECSTHLREVLERNGKTAVAKVYEGQGHAVKSHPEVKPSIVTFFRKHLGLPEGQVRLGMMSVVNGDDEFEENGKPNRKSKGHTER